MPSYSTPGVYREDLFLAPRPEFATGVPVFIGYAHHIVDPDDPQLSIEAAPPVDEPIVLSDWSEYTQRYVFPTTEIAYLPYAVRGFFENGGTSCYVVLLDSGAVARKDTLSEALDIAATLDDADLVCVPDIMRPLDEAGTLPADVDIEHMQQDVLEHCMEAGDRMALLDPLPNKTVTEIIASRSALNSDFGALYYPWVRPKVDITGSDEFIPPCGHIAGMIARSDDANGVFKAPANEVIEGVVDLQVSLSFGESGQLNDVGINALRSLTGRGLRIWGTRTLSTLPQWRYLNVRRLFLTVGRWLEVNMAGVSFEPNEPRLWERIRREVRAYLNTLFTQGALQGQAPDEAFYVKCDAETNPQATRDLGQVIAEIGIAPLHPGEFIVVRIIHGTAGVSIV